MRWGGACLPFVWVSGQLLALPAVAAGVGAQRCAGALLLPVMGCTVPASRLPFYEEGPLSTCFQQQHAWCRQG